MHSGDEELSDSEQNPELADYGDEGEYDHDFEPEQICDNCGDGIDSCTCNEDEQDITEQAECAICGMDESDPVHGGL